MRALEIVSFRKINVYRAGLRVRDDGKCVRKELH